MGIRTTKQVIAINQTAATNAATATGNIDTLGFDFATIDLIATTSNAATNNPSVLKISESDDTVVTNFADVSGAVGDTDFVIANSATSGNWGVKWNIDCRARKRYLRVTVSPLTTQTFTAIANLSKGDAPVTTTSAGVDNLVEL